MLRHYHALTAAVDDVNALRVWYKGHCAVQDRPGACECCMGCHAFINCLCLVITECCCRGCAQSTPTLWAYNVTVVTRLHSCRALALCVLGPLRSHSYRRGECCACGSTAELSLPLAVSQGVHFFIGDFEIGEGGGVLRARALPYATAR